LGYDLLDMVGEALGRSHRLSGWLVPLAQ
jgi:hypothetical protein